jgi:protein NirF
MILILIAIIPFNFASAETLYVVERERGKLAVIENEVLKREIEGLGDLSHGIVKFHDRFAYVISRNGYISKVNTTGDLVEKSFNAGESTIGLDFNDKYLCLANYDPHNVLLLDHNLEVVKVIETGSRNVGIKGKGNVCVFSLMDKDEIWITDGIYLNKFKKIGSMPFDALLEGYNYIVGFFKEGAVGVLDLKGLEYRKVKLGDGHEVIFKIPHFGTWGVTEGLAFIPAVGQRRVYVLDLHSFKIKNSIELIGLPVFVVLSSGSRYAVVNYSGDKEDFISIIDVKDEKIIRNLPVARRVMHMRFSEDGKRLYLSSFFENKLKVLNVGDWSIAKEIDVPTPSGIFIVPKGK